MSGADAQTGDIVRNLTTGRYGRVLMGLQSGRLLVELPVKRKYTGMSEVPNARATWERWDVEIIHKGSS